MAGGEGDEFRYDEDILEQLFGSDLDEWGHLQSVEKSPSFSKFSRSGAVRRVKMSVGVNYQEGADITTYLPF